MPLEPHDAQDDDGPVPFFGTWPRIYGAVILAALVVMAFLALFSAWAY